MALESFQKAMADLFASPEACHILQTNSQSFLRKYVLSSIEERRLISIARQKGMATCCTLYRVNRITPLYTLLPRTCFILGEHLRHEVDLFWNSDDETDLQFSEEISCFAEFLRLRLQNNQIKNDYLEEVLEFELATNELRYLPRMSILKTLANKRSQSDGQKLILHPLIRLVKFYHEPETLLRLLINMSPLSDDLIQGEFYVLLDATKPELEVRKIDKKLGEVLLNVIRQIPVPLSPEEIKLLIEHDLIVCEPSIQSEIDQLPNHYRNSLH